MKTADAAIYRDIYQVRTREVDAAGRLKMSALADYFQEAAAHHTTALQIGPYQLKEYRLAWVLARLRIVIERHPGWGEKLTVHTWPKGDAPLAAARDFRLTDEQGRVVALASSTWLLLDIDAMRPRPLSALPVDFPVDPSLPPAMAEAPEKIPAPSPATILRRRSPNPCDIDLNGHLNNACYLDWVADSLPADHSPVHGVEINYLAEIKAGDLIAVSTAETCRGLVVQGVRESDGSTAFRARIN